MEIKATRIIGNSEFSVVKGETKDELICARVAQTYSEMFRNVAANEDLIKAIESEFNAAPENAQKRIIVEVSLKTEVKEPE